MEDSESESSIDTGSSYSSIENYDFSKPDGGLSDVSSQDTESDDEGDRDANLVETTDNADDLEGRVKPNGDGDQDLSNMSDAERNNFFAQRRMASKKAAEADDSRFIGQLKTKAMQEYVDVEPNEQDLENIDPVVAEQLRELRRNDRAREAEYALGKVQTARENTRLSVMQAESSIPMFNPADKSYNQFFHEEALSEWAHRYAEVAPDANGEYQVVGVREGAPSPLEYLQDKAPRYEAIIKAERARGQQAAYRNRAGSEVSSSNGSGRSGSGNAMSDIEARIGDLPLSSY